MGTEEELTSKAMDATPCFGFGRGIVLRFINQNKSSNNLLSETTFATPATTPTATETSS